MNAKLTKLCMGAFLSFGWSAHAAGLEGSNVEFGLYFPNPTTPYSQIVTAVVGQGVEFSNISNLALPGFIVGNADVDISASSISIDFSTSGTSTPGPFNGYIFNFSGASSPSIFGASLNSGSTFSSTQVIVTFDPNSVFINIPNATSFNPSSLMLVDIQLAPIPEPSSLVLTLSGLLAMCAGVYKAKKHLGQRTS